jgi:hypothetical protein
MSNGLRDPREREVVSHRGQYWWRFQPHAARLGKVVWAGADCGVAGSITGADPQNERPEPADLNAIVVEASGAARERLPTRSASM